MLVNAFIDDRNGYALVKEAFGEAPIPPLFQGITPDEYEGPYALIVKEAGGYYGKYPCGDAESAERSLNFLQRTAETLPPEAVKIAATNLIYSLQHHGLDVPYQVGEAFSVESTMPPTKEAALHLDAMGILSSVIPVDPYWSADGVELETQVIKEAMPQDHDEYALVKEGQVYFPIDTVHRLQEAVAYFEKYSHAMELYDKAMFSYNVARKAQEISMPLPDNMRKYAGEGYEPSLTRAAFFNRSAFFPDDSEQYRFAKQASEQCGQWDRATALLTLEDFDCSTGLDKLWGGQVQDPYLSTHKLAESDIVRVLYDELGTRMTAAQLKDLVRNPGYAPMLEILPTKVRDQLKMNPETVFQSLPDDLKSQIAHIAADNSDGGHR